MALQYYLIDNKLRPDLNDCFAVPLPTQSLSIEDVIERMVSRGSTVTKAEALSVFEELSLAVQQLIKDGNTITTPLFNVQPRITGVFTSDQDTFDRSRHEVKLRIQPGARLKEIIDSIQVEKTTSGRREPVLAHITDSKTETKDEMLSPGGGAKIVGSLLKFDEKATEQGIFFINTANNATTKVEGKLLRHMPGELIFTIPLGLAPGTYWVEVRTLMSGNKNIRTGALPYELTVS